MSTKSGPDRAGPDRTGPDQGSDHRKKIKVLKTKEIKKLNRKIILLVINDYESAFDAVTLIQIFKRFS